MKTIPHRHHAAGKRKIRQRLDRPVTAPSPDPVFTASNIHYDAATKTQAISCGGIGAIHLLVRKLGLAEAIDERLHLLKYHLPYHESDHVLNFAYNALCNGTCLDDIELRRNEQPRPEDVVSGRPPEGAVSVWLPPLGAEGSEMRCSYVGLRTLSSERLARVASIRAFPRQVSSLVCG